MEVDAIKSTSAEPVENKNENENTDKWAKRAKNMATAALPETNGGKPVLKSLQLEEIDQKFSMIPNNTGYWLCEHNTWLQPETDDIQCALTATWRTLRFNRVQMGAVTRRYITAWRYN